VGHNGAPAEDAILVSADVPAPLVSDAFPPDEAAVPSGGDCFGATFEEEFLREWSSLFNGATEWSV
jgi:hypothetical protein